MSWEGVVGPGSPRWQGIDLRGAPAADPVAYGGGLSPDDLLNGYRAGVFPMPAHDGEGALINRTLHEADVAAGRIALVPGRGDPFDLAWYCPDPMPTIHPDRVHLSAELRRLLRNRHRDWHTTGDRCFAEVVAACARDRHPGWITEELRAGLLGLHEMGWAHSIEVWDGDTLIGGLFGVGVGAVFSADSMFHTVSNASRVAIADLADRLRGTGVQMISVQVLSPHLTAVGAVAQPRGAYLATLARSADRVALDPASRPAARLAHPPVVPVERSRR